MGFVLIIMEVIKGLRCRPGCLGREFLSSIKLISFPEEGKKQQIMSGKARKLNKGIFKVNSLEEVLELPVGGWIAVLWKGP